MLPSCVLMESFVGSLTTAVLSAKHLLFCALIFVKDPSRRRWIAILRDIATDGRRMVVTEDYKRQRLQTAGVHEVFTTWAQIKCHEEQSTDAGERFQEIQTI